MQSIAGFHDYSVRVCPILNTLCPIEAHAAQNGDDYRSPDLALRSPVFWYAVRKRCDAVVQKPQYGRPKEECPDLQEVGGKSGARVGCLAMPAEGIPYCLLV